MESAEVGIIGAGIHGVSVGFHLAQRGLKAHIFDLGAPAGGPTGRSSAVCRAFYTNEFLARAARDSLKMLRNFSDITRGRQCDFHQTGGLFLHPTSDRDQLKIAVPFLNSIGIAVDLLEGDPLVAAFPEFELEGVGFGAWERQAGYADPATTTSGLYARACELGMVGHLHNAVTGLDLLPGSGAIVTTSSTERFACDRLLIAAGPWTSGLARHIGVTLPLSVERHVVATFMWRNAAKVPFVFADIPHEYYMKPEGRDVFLVGPLHPEPQVQPDDFLKSVSSQEINDLSTAIARRVPHLSQSVSTGGWASLYDVSPDWQPVIGEIANGVFIDAGTSGHGFKLAPALGDDIAQLVLGHPHQGLRQFSPDRFTLGVHLAAGYGSARILG